MAGTNGDSKSQRTQEQFLAELKAGQAFEDFVNWALLYYAGIVYVPYRSARWQHAVGENSGGIEIKLDRNFRKTGNLFMETEERRTEQGSDWRMAGVYCSDNTRHICIGDHRTLYVLSKRILQMLAESKGYKRVENGTFKGFLLPVDDANKYACDVITITDNDIAGIRTSDRQQPSMTAAKPVR